MGAIKINGASSGSTTITAPASGGDESIELSTALAAKAALASPAFTGTPTLNGSPLGGGLTFVTSGTAAAAGSLIVNGCFTATYANYLLVANFDCSMGDDNIRLRLRASGADNTSANYNDGGVVARPAVVSGMGGGAGATSWIIANGSSASTTDMVLTCYRPQLTAKTGFTAHGQYYNGTNPYLTIMSGSMTVTTAYDGFTIYPNTGTITGTVRVFGLNNS